LAAVRQLGNRYEEAVTLGEIGAVHHRLGHHRLAVLLLSRARAMKRETGNRNGEAETLSELGSAYRGLGRLDHALARHREALALMHEVGDPIGECLGLNDLGATLLISGAGEKALETYRLALTRAERTQNRYEQARAHEGIAASAGDPDEAQRHRRRARELFEEMAVPGLREAPRRLAEIPVQPVRPVHSAPKR
jgi:tetratricopeptide (TPR) repeat protein